MAELEGEAIDASAAARTQAQVLAERDAVLADITAQRDAAIVNADAQSAESAKLRSQVREFATLGKLKSSTPVSQPPSTLYHLL